MPSKSRFPHQSPARLRLAMTHADAPYPRRAPRRHPVTPLVWAVIVIFAPLYLLTITALFARIVF